jgi:hypothetical protein
MQTRHHHPVNEISRPPLRLTAIDRVLYCKGYDLRQCMRDGAPGLLGLLLQAGALVLAVWPDSEVDRRSRSTLIGLACGTLPFIVLSGLLAWLWLSPAQ